MTLASTPPLKDYIEDGATTAHAIPFQFNAASEIRCTRILVGGVEGAALVLGADYNVTGGGGGTGTVVKTSGGTSGATFRIRRLSPESQQTRFLSTGSFPAANVEKALDHEMAVAQEIDVSLQLLEQRSVHGLQGDTIAALPAPANRISRFMQWASDGKSLLMLTASDLAQAVAAPLALLSGAASKGDPGGNAMAIGLFAFASALSIPLGTDVVRTSGYSVKGVGIGDYVADAAVDATYVLAHPREAFVSANARGFRLDQRHGVKVEQLGAIGDNVADDGDALIYAHAKGGTIHYGDTTYKSTKPIQYVVNTTAIGCRNKTRVLFTHVGGGGANNAESTRNGSGFYSNFPINSSTVASVIFAGIWVQNSNSANVGGGFYDQGGSMVFYTHCIASGFKYGIIFDQTANSHIDSCILTGQSAIGLWLVNGGSLDPTAETGFLDQVTVKRLQINEPATCYGLVDDGGPNHQFESINWNGCSTHARFAGAIATISGASQFENAAGPIIVMASTALDGHNVGGNLLVINGPATLSSAAGQPCVHCDTGAGTLKLDDGIELSGGGGTVAAMITGADNLFELYKGLAAVDAFGSPPLYDASPSHVVDVSSLGFGVPATAPGTGLVALANLALRATASTSADGYVSTLAIDHGGNSGQVYVQSLLHLGTGYAEMVFRTRHADGMGERFRISELGAVFTPVAAATPAANGQMVFELTSNTTLKVKVKGSDGTVRSATLTLA